MNNGISDIYSTARNSIDKGSLTETAVKYMEKELLVMKKVLAGLSTLTEVRLDSLLHNIYVPGISNIAGHPNVMSSLTERITATPIEDKEPKRTGLTREETKERQARGEMDVPIEPEWVGEVRDSHPLEATPLDKFRGEAQLLKARLGPVIEEAEAIASTLVPQEKISDDTRKALEDLYEASKKVDAILEQLINGLREERARVGSNNIRLFLTAVINTFSHHIRTQLQGVRLTTKKSLKFGELKTGDLMTMQKSLLSLKERLYAMASIPEIRVPAKLDDFAKIHIPGVGDVKNYPAIMTSFDDNHGNPRDGSDDVSTPVPAPRSDLSPEDVGRGTWDVGREDKNTSGLTDLPSLKSILHRAKAVHTAALYNVLDSYYPDFYNYLKGRVLDIGLETDDNDKLESTNLVTILKEQGVDVVGMDPQVNAHSQFKKRPEFVNGVVQKMPFGDDEFDALISFGLFDFLYPAIPTAQYEQAAREIKRVLKDGGAFLFCTYIENKKFIRAFKRLGFEINIFNNLSGFGIMINHKPSRGLKIKPRGKTPAAPDKTDVTVAEVAYDKLIQVNASLVQTLLADSREPILLRVPVEAIEYAGIENVKAFLGGLQKTPNGNIELYYISTEEEVSEAIYQKYGLEKKALPESFKRTKENTITLFPLAKDEISPVETQAKKDLNTLLVKRLGAVKATETQVIPIGIKNDPAGLLRTVIFGLRIIHIARKKKAGIEIDEKDDFVQKTRTQYKKLCEAQGVEGFDLTGADIVHFATGKPNQFLTALLKLIKLLPITPIDTETLRQIYDHAAKRFA